MKPLLLLLVIALGLAVAAPAAVHAPAELAATAAYPNAMAVLGSTVPTGYGSDPKHPFRESRGNSWATGTNPAVRSIYSRLLAVNPAIRGHAFNFSSHGVTVRDLPAQVRKALERTTKPELLLVQSMPNDVRCDGKDDATRFADYRARVATALQTLAEGLPKARILAVSDWGTLDSYVKSVSSFGKGARLTHAGRGVCSIFAPGSGNVVPEHLAYVRRMNAGYDAAFKAACAAVSTCRYDGGAARRIVLKPTDLSHRFDGLTLAGQAKLAAVEWKALYGS